MIMKPPFLHVLQKKRTMSYNLVYIYSFSIDVDMDLKTKRVIFLRKTTKP